MENKNGQGVFYGVIGVATLIVAIIGATFAYFGASITSDPANISGQTLGGDGGVLSLSVTEVEFTGVTANHNLVPTNLTSGSIATALTNKCVGSEGYTGCHVYEITATATDDVPTATLYLSSLTYTAATTGGVTTDWNYALFDGTVNTAGTGSSVSSVIGTDTFDVTSDTQIWTGPLSLTTGTGSRTTTHYLIVWLADDSSRQDAADENDATGSYTGTVKLSAGSAGTIQATFTA